MSSLRLASVVFLSILLCSFAQAAIDSTGCSDSDASSELGDVRSQGNMGWCYANTAADLISYRFRKDWGYKQASANFIAFGYNYKQNSSEPGTYIFTEGGDIRAATSYASEFKYSCRRELDNVFILGGLNLQLKQKLHTAEKLKNLFNRRNQSAAALNEYDDFISELNEKKSIITFLMPQFAATQEEALAAQKASLAKSLSLDLNLAVVDIAKNVCQPYQLPMSLPREQIRRVHGDVDQYYDKLQKKIVYEKPNMLNIIDRELTDGNVVGIDYSINLISPNLKDTDSHASVLVGRSMDIVKGQCMYKIRNSWGKGCVDHWNGADYPRYNATVKCEESGHVWVTKANLKAALSGFVYIDLAP